MEYIKKELKKKEGKKSAVVNTGDNPKIIFVDFKKIRMSGEDKYYIESVEWINGIKQWQTFCF